MVALAAALLNLFILRVNRALLILTAPLSLGAWGFFAWFFRDPDRVTPVAPGTVYAPADGTIVAIESVFENEYFSAERLKVSISKTHELIEQKKLGHHRFGGAIRVSEEQLQQFLNATERERQEPVPGKKRQPRLRLRHLKL